MVEQPPEKPSKRRKNANANAKPTTKPETPMETDSSKDLKPGSQSCAECKRMKIKCDRVFPCKTCVKRGLEGICPGGSLVTGRGTRYVLASTEELHGKIERMAERIRCLEDALGSLHREHAACPCVPPSYPETHPLLQPDLLLVKGQMDLYGISPSRTQSTDGDTLASDSREPASDSCGRAWNTTARLPSPSSTEAGSASDSKRKYMMDVDVLDLDGMSSAEERRKRLRSLLRFPKKETIRLYDVAVRNFGWLLNCPDKSKDILGYINKIYDDSAQDLEPQHVALVFTVLAAGVRLDFNASNSDASSLDTKSSRLSLELYNNAKTALSFAPMQSRPDYCMLFTVYTLSWYLAHLTDFKDAGRQAWIMVRLAVRMCMKLGLHKEATYKSLPINERFEYRVLFWSIVHHESRLEILGGRSSGSTRINIDCARPQACLHTSPKLFPSRFEAIYHDYKLRFMDDITYPIIDAITNARMTRLRSNDYNNVLDLDARIRDYPIPAILSNWFYHAGAAPFRRRPKYTKSNSAESYQQGETIGLDETPDCPPHISTLIRCLVFQQLGIGLLQLHLPYAHCHVRDHRTVTQRRFLPSAIAAFSAGVSLIESTRKLYEAEPTLAIRVSGFWYNAFVSATWLFILVVLKPFCPVAILAIRELEKVRNLFCKASSNCYMAARSYPILREFYAKARKVYDRWSDATAPQYAELPFKVPDQSLFGPEGAVTLCQNRIDLIIKEIQRVPISPSDDEAAATAGLLDLNRVPASFDQRTSFTFNGRQISTLQKLDSVAGSAMNAPTMDVDETEGSQIHSDDTFYDMWSHVHEEICDFVRRVPEVLRDAQVDPRIATAARLIWGEVPPPPINMEEVEMDEAQEAAKLQFFDEQSYQMRPKRVQVTNDLDWDAITDALMFVSPATTASSFSLSRTTSTTSASISPSLPSMPHSFTIGNTGKDILLTPPSSSEGDVSPTNTTAFPILDACAPIENLYEPLDASFDIASADLTAMQNVFESYALDPMSRSKEYKWPSSRHGTDPAMLRPSMDIAKAKHIDRCSFGAVVAEDETVAAVYEHFGRSPYISS